MPKWGRGVTYILNIYIANFLFYWGYENVNLGDSGNAQKKTTFFALISSLREASGGF